MLIIMQRLIVFIGFCTTAQKPAAGSKEQVL